MSNSKSNSGKEPATQQPVSTQEITQLDNITLLFFAYRDFTADADRALRELDFGRAHHRVLFFVCRKPGMRVAELLQILRITKQSLARVLRQMVMSGYVIQKTGNTDRRHRLLFPTQKGRDLILLLSQIQSRRISRAIENSGAEHSQTISEFLSAMVDPKGQREMEKLIPGSASQNGQDAQNSLTGKPEINDGN